MNGNVFIGIGNNCVNANADNGRQPGMLIAAMEMLQVLTLAIWMTMKIWSM